jgi:hypothetical protein
VGGFIEVIGKYLLVPRLCLGMLIERLCLE